MPWFIAIDVRLNLGSPSTDAQVLGRPQSREDKHQRSESLHRKTHPNIRQKHLPGDCYTPIENPCFL
jgi:hypothetical protein